MEERKIKCAGKTVTLKIGAATARVVINDNSCLARLADELEKIHGVTVDHIIYRYGHPSEIVMRHRHVPPMALAHPFKEAVSATYEKRAMVVRNIRDESGE